MKFDEVVKGRRSIRDYKIVDIPNYIIGEIVEAGVHAPSAGNLQHWKIIVVKDKKKKEGITEACFKQSWMMKAPIFLVICNDKTKVLKYYPKLGDKYSIQGCAMLMQNIMLKAYDLGIGSCLVGAFDKERLKELLAIPEEIDIEGVITLGYTLEKKILIPKRHPIETISYFEKWKENKVKVPETLVEKREVIKEKVKTRGERLKQILRQ